MATLAIKTDISEKMLKKLKERDLLHLLDKNGEPLYDVRLVNVSDSGEIYIGVGDNIVEELKGKEKGSLKICPAGNHHVVWNCLEVRVVEPMKMNSPEEHEDAVIRDACATIRGLAHNIKSNKKKLSKQTIKEFIEMYEAIEENGVLKDMHEMLNARDKQSGSGSRTVIIGKSKRLLKDCDYPDTEHNINCCLKFHEEEGRLPTKKELDRMSAMLDQ